MHVKPSHIIRIALLLVSLVAIVLILKKPAPVAQPQTPATIAEQAQSFDQKMAEFERAVRESSPSSDGGIPETSQAALSSQDPKPEVHISSGEVSAVVAQSVANAGQLRPDSNIGDSAPAITDQRVSLEGDVVHGQFLTKIGGKEVWITISGHLGEKDGYATFDPTEFKVGDLDIPVSLVNPALQRRLQEQRDRLKLPDNVGGLKVENSELVMQGR